MTECPRDFLGQVSGIARAEEQSRAALINNFIDGPKRRGNNRDSTSERFQNRRGSLFVTFAGAKQDFRSLNGRQRRIARQVPAKNHTRIVQLRRLCCEGFAQWAIPNNHQRDRSVYPLPSIKEGWKPLFRRETPDEYSVISGAGPGTGIGIHEMRLDDQLFRRQAGVFKLSARELRNGNVAINLVSPSTCPTVSSQHQCCRSSGDSGTVVAAIGHAAQQTVLDAFLANLAVAQEVARWTEKPEIVQGLNDGHVFLCACPVN